MLKVTLAGSDDRQLEQLLQACGAEVTLLPAAALSSMAQTSQRRTDLLVLDVRHGAAIPQELASVKRQHPTLGVLIVAPSLDASLLLEAMRSGVNEFVTDPLTQESLESAITRVLGQRPTAAPGRVFAFIGAKGGVGTTTVAVNVATLLGGVSKPERTLLADLHTSSGDAALFVGAEPRFSVLDALENIHRLDAAYLRGLVAHGAPGLDLLASSERPVSGPIDTAKIRKLIAGLASAYRFVVLDVPRADAPVLDALDDVNKVVVVANQELATVRSASRLVALLRQRYGAERISVVVSRSDRQADIGHADVERAVGVEVAYTFPSDYRLALQALHKGRPLALDNHNDLSASFKKFAFNLAGIAPEKAGDRSSGGLLGLFGSRR